MFKQLLNGVQDKYKKMQELLAGLEEYKHECDCE